MKMRKVLLAGISTFCALSISAGAASITYIPSPGDSFWTVADDYGVAAGIIQTYNNLHGQKRAGAWHHLKASRNKPHGKKRRKLF